MSMNDNKCEYQAKKCYRTIPAWNNHHDWPPVGGLRSLVFNRHKNGLDDFGVVKKVGKRVLIDEAAFFEWVACQGKKGDGDESKK